MTTTDLIKLLKDNECGGISHKPRELSLTINGKYMTNPQITLSSTGDGICGAEIDLDIDGDFMEEQEPCEDCISRQAVLEALEQEEPLVWCDGADEIAAHNQWSSDVDTIKNMLSVQPKYNANEWCKTCKEYDHDKHCCPRYNKVIRNAVEEIKQPKTGWIPVSERLPKSSGVYIVTREFTDGFECADLTDACYFDGTSTWHDDNRINHGREYVDKKIKAWMPLPKPYKPQESEPQESER